MQDQTQPERSVNVSEAKYTGTSIFEIEGAQTEREAEAAVRKMFETEYGHRPTKVVPQRDKINPTRWTVIATVQSSGSLKEAQQIDITADPEAPDVEEQAENVDSESSADDEAPEGWSVLESDERHSQFAHFRGGFQHEEDGHIEISIYESPGGEWGYCWHDEERGSDDETKEPRYIVALEKEKREIKQERGFEGDFEGAKEQARQFAVEFGDDAPEGWRELDADERDSTVADFEGGYERIVRDEWVEVLIWCPATVEKEGEMKYVFEGEAFENGTEAPRYEVLLIENPPREERTVYRRKTGFEGELEAAQDKARKFAEEYDPEGGEA